jgi:hypothetical protein
MIRERYYDKTRIVPGEGIRLKPIADFRPQIDCGSKKPLYLTPGFSKILNHFLGNNFRPLGSSNIMNPAEAIGKSGLKMQFLSNYIKIFYGHWGGYWQLISYPQAAYVTFDSKMNFARIDYRFIFEGGYAILENVDGKWILRSSQLTWIE